MVAKGCGFDISEMVNQNINGKSLCEMSLQQFVEKFPYGQTLYNNLDLLKVRLHCNFICCCALGKDILMAIFFA